MTQFATKGDRFSGVGTVSGLKAASPDFLAGIPKRAFRTPEMQTPALCTRHKPNGLRTPGLENGEEH